LSQSLGCPDRADGYNFFEMTLSKGVAAIDYGYRSSSEISPRISPSPTSIASTGQAAIRFKSALVRMPLSPTIV